MGRHVHQQLLWSKERLFFRVLMLSLWKNRHPGLERSGNRRFFSLHVSNSTEIKQTSGKVCPTIVCSKAGSTWPPLAPRLHWISQSEWEKKKENLPCCIEIEFRSWGRYIAIARTELNLHTVKPDFKGPFTSVSTRSFQVLWSIMHTST